MKNPYVIMSQKQKYNILSNGLMKRLDNVNKEETSNEEHFKLIEEMIQEMENSGWDMSE